MVRHTSGYICVAADRGRRRPARPAADVRESTRTGAAPPTRSPSTPARASAPASPPPTAPTRSGCSPTRDAPSADLTRPGHVVPLRAKDGGVLRRPGHTEAAVDLAVLAGLRPAGVLCEIVSEKDPIGMARRDELRRLRRRARPGDDLHRRPDRLPQALRASTSSGSPRRGSRPRTATFRAVGYRSSYDGAEHVALVYGDIGDGEDVLVRVHSECLTGDVFGSLRCDCGPQLDAALAAVAAGGPRRRALHARPRGPRHRPAAQAAGLPAAGRRVATPSTPTSSSACPPTPATTAPARRSSSTSACAPCGC